MALNPQLIPVRKDPEIIRKEVLTNCIKMLHERGYITSVSNALHYIDKPTSNDIYIIKLDTKMQPDINTAEYVKQFKSNEVAVKILRQKIMSIKNQAIKEFQDGYAAYHKIFIFEGITDKIKSSLTNVPNTEVFTEAFLMINIVEHIDSPKYELLTEDETKQVLETYIVKRKELPKILTTDPIVAYFNLKRGQIIRIIRCSEQSGFSVIYRIVAKGGS